MLADRLSADSGSEVVVLEAGGEDKDKFAHIPAAFSKLFRSEVDWDYLTEPQTGARRAQDLLAARQDARRLVVDERDDVGARVRRRLRRVG